ncbi:MAG: hypothetical protein LBJ41_12070 [Treponema sp.]|jgi:hypothetical protein|nr:hypothetical protein [Treponema sp.]
MTTSALRKELHSFIDTIPKQRLPALKPLLADKEGKVYLMALLRGQTSPDMLSVL